jgi:hypothetical protein
MTDLTGWTPHDGDIVPETVQANWVIVPLFRGTPEHGPHEGHGVQASTLDWKWHPALNGPPDPMDVLMGKAPLSPAADIIAWRLPGLPAVEYPHVRADLGL